MAVRIPKQAKVDAPKPKHLFQESPHKEEAMQILRDELPNKEVSMLVREVATRFDLAEKTIYRYLKEVRGQSASGVVEEKPGSSTKVVKEPTPLAVVTTKTPAPIVFRMGDQQIDLNPGHLYDAWRFCQDIKRIEPTIDDDFSLMVRVAVEHVWEEFSHREARRVGVNLAIEKEAV